ncbi:MAG TPA: hypothetical protein VFJ30_09550 [Phycisphaerae bacterium]|nr:hypothetical protein [Phycisphaerae bacterium]
MAPPLYFFPAITREQLAPAGKLDRELLITADLAGALADCEAGDCSLMELSGAGPGGHSGTILCALPADQRAPTRLGYYPDFQTWTEVTLEGPEAAGRPLPAAGRSLFVGLDNEHPPGPGCLARKRQIPGYDVELGDGRPWTVPVIRDPKDASRLPSRWTYGPGRKARTTLRAEYRAVWESWGPVVQFFFDPTGSPDLAMGIQEAMDRCLRVLALNYRVGPHEQSLLDLVGPDTWDVILAASVDLPGFRDVYDQVHQQRVQRAEDEQKKTEQAEATTMKNSPATGDGACGRSTPAGPGATASAAPAGGSPGGGGP